MSQKNTFDIPSPVRMSLAQNGETIQLGPRTTVRMESDDEDTHCYTVGQAKRQFRQMARRSDKVTYGMVVPQNPSIFAFDKS